jgi:hypothetical protein
MALLRTLFAAALAVLGLVLLAPILVIIFPFWLVSALTRGISRLLEPRFLTREQLIQFDPVFGWRSRPNLDTHHLMVDLFHLRTDQDGWRGPGSLDQSDLVVFGDSFAAGYGIGEHHLFANLSGQLKIKPVGTGGYSMVQELLWMQRLAPRLRAKLIVWFVYHGNDLYDNLTPDLRGYRKPFLRECGDTQEWEIVSSHVRSDPWPIVTQTRMQGENHLPKLAEMCSDTFLANRAYSACEYLIRAGKQVCDEAGATLYLMTVPDACQLTRKGKQHLQSLGGDASSFDADLPDKKLESICHRLGVEFIRGSSFLDASCYKTNDCHWNEKGHRVLAKRLVQLYAEAKTKSAPPELEVMRA